MVGQEGEEAHPAEEERSADEEGSGETPIEQVGEDREVLLPHVGVDLDGIALAIEAVGAILPRARDPVVLAGLEVVEVGN